ncbi:Polysaccharide deacetylase [uncultured archaeon]|nr:Polysaccharide deacetylase [uncultured archaeon]
MNRPNVIMSIDLEWFFHNDMKLFYKMDLSERKSYNGEYIQKAVDTILDICSKNDSKLTFFVSGEIYDAYPDLLYKIKKEGHEIAYHGHDHRIIHNKNDLEQEFKVSKNFIDEYSPKGFRAPNVRMDKDCLKLLEDYGIEYDSSIYGTKRFKFNNITVLPISVYPYFKKTYIDHPNSLTFNLISESIPFGSGLFFGLMRNKTIYFMKKYLDRYKEPPIIIVHSWQIAQPKMPLMFKFKNPFMVPYSIELIDVFNSIVSQFNTLKMCDYMIR